MKMDKKENKDTRYFIDIKMTSKKIVRIDSGDRYSLREESLPEGLLRIYLTKGQFGKLKSLI
ncbi:MAG: hypothetical protein BWZ03_00422 [bacterium ADurb.BinA186]|nr:MAG: hypothetical protein BWZ03_00422 [bacterium ADurb.BinA186]